MLCLTLTPGRRVRLDTTNGVIWITVLPKDRRNQLRLGFEAPDSVKILREDLLLKIADTPKSKDEG